MKKAFAFAVPAASFFGAKSRNLSVKEKVEEVFFKNVSPYSSAPF